MKRPAIDLANRATLRPAEVAQVTGLSGSHVKRLLRSGEMKSKKSGDARLIKVTDVLAWIESLKDAA